MGRDQRREASSQAASGSNMTAPVAYATVRALIPASMARPAAKLEIDSTSIAMASSAAKTRPRKRSSVCWWSIVVDAVQMAEAPA